MFCVSLANVSFYYKQAEAIITLLFDRICGWFYWQLPVSFMHTSHLLQGNFNAELSFIIALCFLPSQQQGFGWRSWTISVCKLEVMWGPVPQCSFPSAKALAWELGRFQDLMFLEKTHFSLFLNLDAAIRLRFLKGWTPIIYNFINMTSLKGFWRNRTRNLQF